MAVPAAQGWVLQAMMLWAQHCTAWVWECLQSHCHNNLNAIPPSSLEIPEIYVAAHALKLLPFFWSRGRIVQQFYCSTKGTTLALRGNNTAIQICSGAHRGPQTLHSSAPQPSEQKAWELCGVRDTTEEQKGTVCISAAYTNSVCL